MITSFWKKHTRISKVCSVALVFIMMVNMTFGYSILTQTETKEVQAAAVADTTPQYRNVMYYGEWSIYAGQKNFTVDKIRGDLITHLNFAFMDVDANGDLLLCDYWADADNPNVGFSVGSDSTYAGVLGAMVLLRNKYPNMKIGISVGGWTRSGDFPKLAAKESTRKHFAENIAKFVHYYGYDFVDIDWEYPTADRDPDPDGNGVTVDKGCKGSEADSKNFTYMLQDIREQLDQYGAKDGKYYELSVAMSASPAMMAKIEYDKVLDTVDFANMMTYDLNGAWAGYTAHQTALYTNDAYDPDTQADGKFSIDTCIQYLENTYGNDIDYSKIVIGVAPYTRGWAEVQKDGRDPENPGLYATAAPNSVKAADGTTSGTYAYSDIDELISRYHLKEYYDEKAEAAYYYSEETGYFFTCDNERSVAAKGNYVKEKKLGGLISWMASLDSASAITEVMKKSLYGDENLPAQEIKMPAIDNIQTTVEASGNTYTINIKNNNTLTESNAAVLLNPSGDKASLPYAEKFAETVTYPTFYIKTKDGAVLTGAAWQTGGSVTAQNGYTVVTSTQYDAQKIEPGATRTIILTTTGTADISNIESISMSRKATSSGEEFGMQDIYGAASGDIPVVTTTKSEETTETESTTAAGETTEKSTTTEEQITTATGTGTYDAWKTATTYRVGDIVTYQNKVYECIQGHTSHDGWKPTDPGVLGILWKERTDLVHIPETTVTGETGNQETTTEDNYTVNTALPQHTVTGYWHNFVNAAGAMKLGDVPSYYDIICVSFTGNTTTPGEVTFELDKDLCNALGGYTKAEFIQDIKNLKAKGQHVIISVGGAEGRIEINSDEAAQRFANELISIIKEYGFEGVDIDLEGSAVAGVDYIAEALRTVHGAFDDNFIITMAPETYYIQADRLSWNDITTSYLRLALKIKDILTVCHPQFYNSGGMNGYGGTIVNPGNADFLTSLSTLVIEAGLRPDQVAMGVPSTSQAGSGYVEPAVVKNAFYSMIQGTSSGSFIPPKAYPTFRGVMTWSINWDRTNNYEWGKAMADAVHALNTEEMTTKEPVTTEEQTTGTSHLERPIEVIGLAIASQTGAKVSFVWQQTQEQIASGQTYNVYIDGKLYKSYPSAGQDTYTFTSNGTYEIKVTAVRNGYESIGQSVSVTVSGIVEPTETTYTVSVDGNTVMTAKEGDNYTLPRTARVGYYADGKLYKKGSSYTVTKDVNFSSVDLTANSGASIRLAEPSGLTFKAAITCTDSSLFTSGAIVNEGMLITTNDIYSEEGILDFTSEYTYVNIENSGWNGGVAGAFTGSIAGIRSMNYGRTYIGRAYVTVKFADGTESILYSKMTGVRSVRSVAVSMKNTPSVYNTLTTAQKALIDSFAAAE